jgi:hypothetical protein
MPIAENPVPDWQHSRGIDVVMTHGPPMGILDAVRSGDHVGCEHLLRAMRRCKPKLHCFGHIHEGWGAQKVKWKSGDKLDVRKPRDHVKRSDSITVDDQQMRGKRAVHIDISSGGGDVVAFGRETLMVNASIMSLTYRPFQAPWLVDIDLEQASVP